MEYREGSKTDIVPLVGDTGDDTTNETPAGSPNSTVENAQGALFNMPGYVPAYYDMTGLDNTTLNAWQSLTVDLNSTPGYADGSFDLTTVDFFRIKVAVAGDTAPTEPIPVVFYLKNIRVGTDGDAFNQPVTLADSWLTSSYVSQGTATLTLEEIGGSPLLKVTGASGTDSYAGVEIQFSFDGGTENIDMTGKTLSYDIYIPSER